MECLRCGLGMVDIRALAYGRGSAFMEPLVGRGGLCTVVEVVSMVLTVLAVSLCCRLERKTLKSRSRAELKTLNEQKENSVLNE